MPRRNHRRERAKGQWHERGWRRRANLAPEVEKEIAEMVKALKDAEGAEGPPDGPRRPYTAR